MSTIRILLAEDHHLVRQGLRAILEAEPGLEVVAETSDGVTALEAVLSLRPHVLVVDIFMPRMGGLEVTRRVAREAPSTHVVVLSMHANEAYLSEALEGGAYAYVLKCSQSQDLIAAVRAAASGHRYLSPPLSESRLEEFRRKVRSRPSDAYETLTGREVQVLHWAASGLSNSEVAFRLSISPRTAEKHRANMMRKLNLGTQTDLVRYAVARGLTPIEGS